MEFAPLPLEKQIKGVNQNWLNWPFALFQVLGPYLHKNASPTTNISCSLIHFYHPKHCRKTNSWQWEEFLKQLFRMFWRLGRVKISSQSNDKKQNKTKQNKTKQKWLIIIKKEELQKEEKGKDNENLQDMCKNHHG